MTIRHILCPVDLSDASAHALEQAVHLARWYKARITALHVDTTVDVSIDPLTYPAVPAFLREPSEQQRLRDRVTAFCQPTTGTSVPLEARVVTGHAAAAILDESTALAVDLIVMGTHGLSGFRHLVLGSITEKVLRRATCPVLTVPPRAHATSRLPFRQVLCGVDFSDPSLQAVQFAGSLATEAGASLVLMHVIEWPWHEPPAPRLEELPPAQAAALAQYRRDVETAAAARLASVAATVRPPGTTAATRVAHGKPYEQLLEAARTEEADLIVLGVHGRNVLDLGLFGSTANQLVRAATCPVLTVRR